MDDMYPNNGEYFQVTEPEDQVIERKKDRAHTLEALPVIKELIEMYDRDIAELEKLSSIDADIDDDPALHQKMYHVNRSLVIKLQEKRQFLQEKLELYERKPR